MATEAIQTKYGKARINEYGYYRINSSIEGNHLKLLHRLVFEDFYNIKLPSHIEIHHEDGNKLNNEIWNLVPMTKSEHMKLHIRQGDIPFYSKPQPLSHKQNISRYYTTTGIFRVTVSGDGYNYLYYNSDNKRRALRAVTISKLKEKVLERGFDWIVLDEELAEKTERESQERYRKKYENHSTGIRRVRKKKSKTSKQGFLWEYVYQKDNKTKYISSTDLDKLKEKVLANGLEWEVI